jgi:hypothetical protein
MTCDRCIPVKYIHVAEVQPVSCEGELMPLRETIFCLIVGYSLLYLQLSSYAHAPSRVINWTYQVATSVSGSDWWFWQGLCFPFMSRQEVRGPHHLPVKAKALLLSNDVFLWWMIHRWRLCDPMHPLVMWPLVLYVPCIVILLPFINQHLCTTVCLRNHLLVTTSMRFVLYWHHFQGDFLPVNSSQHIQVIINTCWPLVIRPQFFKHSWTVLNIIKAPSSRHTLYGRSFIDIQSCAAVFEKLRFDNIMVSKCL